MSSTKIYFSIIICFINNSLYSQFYGCWQPPGVNFEFCLDDELNLSVNSSSSLVTPLGKFTVGVSPELPLYPKDNEMIVIIKSYDKGYRYSIKDGNKFTLGIDGRAEITFKENVTTIDISQNNSAKIIIKNNNNLPSKNNFLLFDSKNRLNSILGMNYLSNRKNVESILGKPDWEYTPSGKKGIIFYRYASEKKLSKQKPEIEIWLDKKEDRVMKIVVFMRPGLKKLLYEKSLVDHYDHIFKYTIEAFRKGAGIRHKSETKYLDGYEAPQFQEKYWNCDNCFIKSSFSCDNGNSCDKVLVITNKRTGNITVTYQWREMFTGY